MSVFDFNDFEATSKNFLTNYVEFGDGISINPLWIVIGIGVLVIIGLIVHNRLK